MLSHLGVAKPSAEDLLHCDLGCILEVNLEYINNGWLSKECMLWSELPIFNQCCIARVTCAVIPEPIQVPVPHMAHDSHLGIVHMKQRCREVVWCPKITTHMERVWSLRMKAKVTQAFATSFATRSIACPPIIFTLSGLKWPAQVPSLLVPL